MVELRKRKEAPTSPPPLTKRNSGTMKKMVGKAKAALSGKSSGQNDAASDLAPTSASVVPPEQTTGPGATELPQTKSVAAEAASAPPANGGALTKVPRTGTGRLEPGSTVPFDSDPKFGGDVETHEGKKTTLKDLVEASGAGLVIFTYPKAGTPGCTTQACLFRDSYLPISGASLNIYGLSTDSPKSNTTFVTKQSLPYPLLCDPSGKLIKALGFGKVGNKTARGVIVIDRAGKVRVHVQGGPQATLDAVLDYIKGGGMELGAPAAVAAPPADDPKATEAAAKLAEPEVVGLPAGAANVTNPPEVETGMGVPTDMSNGKVQGVDPDDKMDDAPLQRQPTREEKEAAETAAEVSESARLLDTEA